MFPVINSNDLRIAYGFLQIAKETGKLTIEKQDEIKRAIRAYNHKEKPFEHIVKDDGIDGYVLLMELPEFLDNKEEAEEYFEEHHAMHAMPSIYDCTGQAFTVWYKIFKRRNRFYAYHSVGFDV